MSRSFDLVAIGSGAAASGVAIKCRKAGWSVALIDSQPLGGTCAVRGCDPKKVLVGGTEALDWTERLAGKGVRSRETKIDWPELMRFKRSFTEPVPAGREKSFTRAGIEVFHGRTHFAGPNTVEVNGEVLEARYVHIGAGAKPRELEIPGSEHVVTSTDFLELDELPKRLLFVGGGYISFEFAHVAARVGSNVTLLHRSRALKGFDPDLVDQLVERTRNLGIDVHLDTEVHAVEKHPGGLTVRASSGGEDVSFEPDGVVDGAGRVPDIDDMELDKAGVERSPGGIVVNEYLQSISNPSVYAAGDAADTEGAPLTPVAAFEGHIVASNLLDGNHRTTVYPPIPSVVFTLPPLANLFAMAMHTGLKPPDIKKMIFAYPTIASDIAYMV